MVVRTPSVSATRSLIAIGTPASGRSSPRCTASASARARSSHSVTNAFSSPFRRPMASYEASTSSRAETSPALTAAASSPAGRNIRSSAILHLHSLGGQPNRPESPLGSGGIIARGCPPATDLGAILTAMVTPFDSDGAVREDATRRLARHLVEHGSDGVVVAGTTGEAPTLDDAEKLRLIEIVVDEVGDSATVVAGTGSNDTAHSVRPDAAGVRAGGGRRARRHALLQQAEPARARGALQRRRGRHRPAGAALQHPGALRDQPRARTCSPSWDGSTTSSA